MFMIFITLNGRFTTRFIYAYSIVIVSRHFAFFFFSSRRRHTRCLSDWSSDVCSSDLSVAGANGTAATGQITVKVKGEDAVTVDLVNGQATVNLGKFGKKGKKKVTVDYLDRKSVV